MNALICLVAVACSLLRLPDAWLQAVETIDANRVRTAVHYLASDELEGRDSPSDGLNSAAEFIAKSFERAGLDKLLESGYLQTTNYKNRRDIEGQVSNVVGVLRGQDPLLKETYVLITAHYDHLGKNERLEGDQIFNGANDNASGTAGVMELAEVLGKAKIRTKRSIVFIAFWGEERGMLGAKHFLESALIPVDKIVAVINLEQIGRTDDNEGPRIGAVSMTGYDYSDIGPIFAGLADASGVKTEKHARNSDAYFGASDNIVFAQRGIPAHTICTAFMFPDYHRVSDHADKLDYQNMVKVLRLIGLGLLSIADSEKPPAWNLDNPRAKRFHDARSGGN
jgi:Zn-dependent M28 family amino/carboxypeptidase